MGLLDRAIKRGLSNAVSGAVSGAVEKGVRQVVQPKLEQAASNVVNKAAGQINQAAGTQQSSQPQLTQPQNSINQAEVQQAANTLGGLFGGLTSAAGSFANEAAKNMKLCPSCGEPAKAEVKFCPKCGGKMPEQTIAQGAVCSSCGTQNSIGTKFCQNCGTKLPAAIQEEQAAQAKDSAVMLQWDEKLSEFPKWNCGGSNMYLDDCGDYCTFSIHMQNNTVAQNAVRQYRELLLQNGFQQAGQYPGMEHLYKRTAGGICHVDTEHCFDGDSDTPCIGFDHQEPTGGFDYVKPEPKKAVSWKSLFK